MEEQCNLIGLDRNSFLKEIGEMKLSEALIYCQECLNLANEIKSFERSKLYDFIKEMQYCLCNEGAKPATANEWDYALIRSCYNKIHKIESQ